MIRNCGLVKPGAGIAKIAMAYGIYRTRDDGVDSTTAKLFRAMFSRTVDIKFLGVWDTVGALGIPLRVAKVVNEKFYGFHDTKLSSIVQHAYHAIAVDEHREDYQVCLWDPDHAVDHEQVLEQRWFCGAHADVGGGYPSRKLSDITLAWMQSKAAAAGLKVQPATIGADFHLGDITDSYAAFLAGRYQVLKRRFFRNMLATHFGNEKLDDSIHERSKATTLNPRYAPQNAGFPPV
jgi:uncharacterized protein (DUF2235 family)